MTASPLGFTALTAHGNKIATKKITRDKVSGEILTSGYDNAYEFRIRPTAFVDIADLYAKLSVLLTEPKTFIVRGAPKRGVDLERSRRLLYPETDDNDNVIYPETFEPCARQWIMIDGDWHSAPGMPSDPDEARGYFVSRLPEELHGVDYIFSWSSSHKLTSDLSAHLFLLLDKPYTDKELERWARTANARAGAKLIDDAVLRPVQPHYTAAPIFGEGVSDPIPGKRIGMHIGVRRAASLVIPHEDEHDSPIVPHGMPLPGGFRGHIALIGSYLGFRGPMVSAIGSYISVHGDRTNDLVPILQAAVQAADPGGRNAKKIATYASERYIKDKIKWTVKQERRRHSSIRSVPPLEAGDFVEDQTPEIRIVSGELPRATDEAEAALKGAGIYQRGNMLVRLVHEPSPTVKGVVRDSQSLIIMGIDSVVLVDELTRRVRFTKWSEKRAGDARCNAPVEVASTLLSRAGRWDKDNFPYLVGILTAPTIRPDGSVLCEGGYDEATGLYLSTGAVQFPAIPENPTKEDALRALELLLEVISEFPFEDRTDRAAAVAAMITGLIRKSIYSAPLFIYSAPKPRSGKSKLATVVGILATGHRPATMTYKDDPDEEAKRYMSLLMAGDPVINIDNISADLGGDALCTILTEPTWTDRMLGRNDASAKLTVSTCATFTATGNNLVVRADLAARTLPCRIDPKVEHPEQREFEVDPVEEAAARRGELVVAALTVVRAYQQAGSPEQGCPTWGGFEAWCRWVRDPLVWLGMADAADGRRHVEESDPIHQDLVSLLSAWRAMFGGGARSVSEAIRATVTHTVEMAAKASALREAILQIAGTAHGDVNTRKLGKFISAYANRIEGGMCFKKNGLEHKAVLWSATSESELKPNGG